METVFIVCALAVAAAIICASRRAGKKRCGSGGCPHCSGGCACAKRPRQ
ncbi:MAG: hypothetical protein IJI37_04395 [Opitutales bacterium]|nr:hypothetical protein [Opitutales bacterium]